MNNLNLYKYILLLMFGLSLSLDLHAGWWIFGTAADVPEISELKFNRVDVERVGDELLMGKDDLDLGRIIVRGQAEVQEGSIGRVDVSWDGGKTWNKASLDKNGLFNSEFKPDTGREYEFRIRSITTTGKKNDPEEHAFTVVFGEATGTDAVIAVFRQMLRAYMGGNAHDFMQFVADDFEGDRLALEDAIDDDFRYFDNIRIEPNIMRVVQFDNHYEIYFTFNRSLQSVRSGKLLRDSAATSMSFVRAGGGLKLADMAAPVIFGVSDPTETATSVTEESVGKDIIKVDEDGNASTSPQGETVSSGAGAVVGSAILHQDFGPPPVQEGFLFENDEVVDLNAPSPDFDFSFTGLGMDFTLNNGSQGQDLGAHALDDIRQVPTSGYSTAPLSATIGHVYAFQLANGNYAILQVTGLVPGSSLSFDYKYQPNGGTGF